MLSGATVHLRPIVPADADALFAVFRDHEVMRYWSSPPMADREEAVRWIEEIEDSFRRRILFQWAIAAGTGGPLLGTCTLHRWETTHRRAEIGFALGRQHWGQGRMREALTVLIEFCFHDLRLHRLEADTDPRNERSLGLLARLGFRREGLLRERYHVLGEAQDSVLLGLLAREWKPFPPSGERGPAPGSPGPV